MAGLSVITINENEGKNFHPAGNFYSPEIKKGYR
jgi:hypothetical protein